MCPVFSRLFFFFRKQHPASSPGLQPLKPARVHLQLLVNLGRFEQNSCQQTDTFLTHIAREHRIFCQKIFTAKIWSPKQLGNMSAQTPPWHRRNFISRIEIVWVWISLLRGCVPRKIRVELGLPNFSDLKCLGDYDYTTQLFNNQLGSFFVAQMLFSEDQNFQNCLRIALGSIGKTQESPKETMFLG